MADIPSGTGLGSSGSFTVGLLRALHALPSRARVRRRIWPRKRAHRDRPALPARREAGSVHRRLRRTDLLRLPPRDTVRSVTLLAIGATLARSRGPAAAVLHRLLALGRVDPRRPRDAGRIAVTPTMIGNLDFT